MSHKTDLYSLDIKQLKKRLEFYESQSPISFNYYPFLLSINAGPAPLQPAARIHGYRMLIPLVN